jgi:DNA-binding HxlR family transcriptional regulator
MVTPNRLAYELTKYSRTLGKIVQSLSEWGPCTKIKSGWKVIKKSNR